MGIAGVVGLRFFRGGWLNFRNLGLDQLFQFHPVELRFLEFLHGNLAFLEFFLQRGLFGNGLSDFRQLFVPYFIRNGDLFLGDCAVQQGLKNHGVASLGNDSVAILDQLLLAESTSLRSRHNIGLLENLSPGNLRAVNGYFTAFRSIWPGAAIGVLKISLISVRLMSSGVGASCLHSAVEQTGGDG